MPRPPRVTRHHREHRIDEALDELHALERASPQDRPAIDKARRRVGRIRSAINQQLLRHQFDTPEKECVDDILTKACTERAARAGGVTPETGPTTRDEEQVDDGVCPISSDDLWRFFDGVNTPRHAFDAEAPDGAAFRAAMARLPAATRLTELLSEPPTFDDIEVKLQHVRGASAPGLDGVGYDVYQRFSAQLLPVPQAVFSCCWAHKKSHRVGNLAWYVYFTRKVRVMTWQIGGPSASSKPFTSCTLGFFHGGWCGGWKRTIVTRQGRRDFGR
ncbi:hypothetical protein DD238_007980 [Peronospora effusa]|uniref:Reverse transcriptase domain-containing protein n=1 Tax=Peronospora effusa TaxID=542832 RepID=A0A3M6V9V2_9STRA|nr:hypothetical protein DD238_007980 [Peronospora effusa]